MYFPLNSFASTLCNLLQQLKSEFHILVLKMQKFHNIHNFVFELSLGFSTKKVFFSRFLPAYVKLQEELKNKTIGDVYSVNVLFGENITSDRVFKKELGGGSVLDIGVYCIQVQTHMTRQIHANP